MNTQDYEKMRQECWNALYNEFLKGEVQWQPVSRYDVFCAAFDRAYALGKHEKGADTVIQGWVARDQDGYISLFKDKPTRDTFDKDDVPYGFWDEANSNHLELPITSFPDLTWESDPIEVELVIKRKKNGNNSTYNRI